MAAAGAACMLLLTAPPSNMHSSFIAVCYPTAIVLRSRPCAHLSPPALPPFSAQALRGATQLEVLHWYTAQMPTLLDWDAVSSLPALRHLRIITDRSFPEAGCAAMRSMACKSMPQVALQMTNYHCEQCSSEFAAAAARLTVS